MFGSKKDLEALLLANGVITETQNQQAKELSRREGIGHGDAVASLGFASEEEIAKLLSDEYGYPFASHQNKMLELELGVGLEDIIPEEFAREHCALPVFQEGKVLAVALADPGNLYVVENLQILSGFQIQPLIATRTDILKAIDQLYQRGSTDLIARTMRTSEAGDGEEQESFRNSDARVDLDQTLKGGDGTYAVNLVNAILKQAIAERCSDIHLETMDREVMLRFRIDGALYSRVPPPYGNFTAIISRIKILANMNIAERRLPQDGSFTMKLQNRFIDVRTSVCPAAYGEKIVMRLLDKDSVPLNLDKLGFERSQHADFHRAATQPNGLILLTGPTGSGKTTTLYSLLNRIKTRGKNFMSIEDPIEIKLKGMTQLSVRSEIGLTFASALRSFLRQDPDVILVGEIRDLETAQTCLRASLTGHLVLSTLHTNDALSSVVRLIDLGAEPFLIASSLALVAAQRLLRVLCPHCRKAYHPPESILSQCASECMLEKSKFPAKPVFYNPAGCPKCSGTGYAGRIGVFEIFPIDQALRAVISQHHGDLDLLLKSVKGAERLTLRASAWMKVLRGVTSVEEVLAVTADSR